MITKNINFKNFTIRSKNHKISKKLKLLIKENNPILETLKPSYKYSYKKKLISDFKKYTKFTLIGMGGSILGAKAIYNFLNHKIKKNFLFIDNLDQNFLNKKKKK